MTSRLGITAASRSLQHISFDCSAWTLFSNILQPACLENLKSINPKSLKSTSSNFNFLTPLVPPVYRGRFQEAGGGSSYG